MVLHAGMCGDEKNPVKVVSSTVLGDNPTYGGIRSHKEMANGATEQSHDNNMAPTVASTQSNANDRSLTISGSHSYEYVTTRHFGYRVQQGQDQVEGQRRQIEESTESSGIYYSIEYTQTRRNGLQLLQIKPTTSPREQLPSSLNRTQTAMSSTSAGIPQHYETMENVLPQCHTQITAI